MTPDQLTPHFTFAEALRGSGVTSIPPAVLPNVKTLALILEQVRQLLGDRPIVPTSWYRTPAKQAELAESHGASASSTAGHPQGFAADFVVPGMSPKEVVTLLAPHVAALGIDQLIEYPTHVHISADPRRRAQLLLAERIGSDTTYKAWTSSAPRPVLAIAGASEPGAPKKGSVLWYLAIAAGLIELARHLLGNVRP